MGEKRNFAALDWVLGEISDTLKEARQSLEAYVEDPKDSTRIRFCLTHIHQVHGSLQMVEFHGAALLAEEMEQTAQAIMDNSVVSIPEAQEVLMRGLLQLPIFLEHVKSNKEDNPMRVMPLLNDLRAVRKQSYLSETNLFCPDLSSVGVVEGEKHPVVQDRAKLAQVLKKLREMYQFAAASVLRGIKVEENLAYLDKVFSRLELISSGTPGYPVWEVSAALIEGLQRDDIELTVAVRGLLRYLARELRILGENAPAALDTKPRESLLKNLLYYVARAEDGSEKVNRVKAKYKLKASLLGTNKDAKDATEDMLQAPDAGAIRSVVVALQDELGGIKQVLDASLSGQGSGSDVKEVLPAVKRVADTLAVLGIGDLRKQMLAQSERLEKISEANTIDEQELMRTAGNIIEIEHRLRAIAKSAGKNVDLARVDEREVEIDNAKAAVVKECAAGLLSAKESIIDYISSQWDKQHLENVGTMLMDIRGGLNMIPLRRPAAIINSCANYIQEKLIDGSEHPSFQSLESLADAMASVEYYLERLMENLHEDSDSMLDIAEESVADLGYQVALPEPAPVAAISEVTPAPEELLAVPEVGAAEPEGGEALAPVPQVEQASVAEEETTLPEPDVAAFGETAPTAGVAEQAPAAAAPEPTPEPEVEESRREASPPDIAEAPAPQPAAEERESDIDDEIIEIFIEEAGEVLETLEEHYPQWRSKDSDQDALVVVRRAFHTLKGSGRMVEAFDIGELAWSVENMLNRVIDRTIRVQPHIFHLVDAVIAVIPVLVEAFEKRIANPVKELTSEYEAWAHEISEGNFPAALADPVPLYGQASAAVPVQEPVAEATDDAAAEPHPEPSAETTSPSLAAFDDSDEEEESVDRVLQEIFSQESVSHLQTLEDFIRQMDDEAPLYSVPTDALQRALHTLKGSAKMAQVWPIAEIAEPLEHLAKELIAYQVRIDEDILQLLRDAVDYTRLGVEQIDADEKVDIPKVAQFVARTLELRELALGHIAPDKGEDTVAHKVDPRMLSLVMAEEIALLLEADKLLDRCRRGDDVAAELDSLISELAVLAEGARQANFSDMCSLSEMLGEAHQLAVEEKIPRDEQFFTLMYQGHEALLDMVDAVAAGQNIVSPSDGLTSSIRALLDSVLREETPRPEVAELPAVDETIEFEPEIQLPEEDFVIDFGDEPQTSFDVSGGVVAEETQTEDDSLFEQAVSLDVEDDEGAEITFELDDASEEFAIDFETGDGELLETLASEDGAVPALAGELHASEPEETIAQPMAEESGANEELSFTVAEEEERSLAAQEPGASEQVPEVLPETDAIEFGETAAFEVTEISADIEPEAGSAEIPLDISHAETPPFEAEWPVAEEKAEAQSAEFMAPEEEVEAESAEFIPPGEAVAAQSAEFMAPEGEVEAESAEFIPPEEAVEAQSAEFMALEEEVEAESAEFIPPEEAVAAQSAEFMAPEGEVEAESAEFIAPEEAVAAQSVEFMAPEEEAEAQSAEFVAPELEAEVLDTPSFVAEDVLVEMDPSAPAVAEVSAIIIPGLIDPINIHSDDFDRDIIEVFLEEAEELVEGLDESIHSWESNWSDTESVEEIKRILHTLKGGARLAGLNNLGELTHDYETRLIELGEDLSDVDEAFFGHMLGYQDRILNAVRAVKTFVDGGYEAAEVAENIGADDDSDSLEAVAEPPESPLVSLAELEEAAPSAAEEPAVEPEPEASNVLKFQPKPKDAAPLAPEPGEFVMPTVGGGQAAASVALKKAGPQEVIKVSSELLEELVNLAGETSINRSRLEQYVNDFNFALDEVDSTLNRLQDQLRRLDIETEAQILFRQEQMEAHDEFDPLEMDRYSHLQQLSRSLIESASDLTDLKSDLSDKLKVTETLLVQQSRINTNLQEGLMRSRMVPFSRMVPRLRRIVRQVASELGKRVSFELDNVEGELDRSVLERMVPPFEHMLRNAVDHGIEAPEDRIAAGKAETGRIVLTLSREGGDVIIRLADDGRGIDLKRVREKAIEREMMAPDAELSDHDVMQFILHAGFSTAEKVSQISGRGVGMDVVNAEIKQLGGGVMINSAWGKGTEFVIRLPFTLSVNRALMVAIGQDHYAVPLSSIEGIVRVSPFELEHYYANPDAQFEYANENYQVRYLGSLLYRDTTPHLEGHVLPLPVLLVRSAEHTMALQVDAVMGSREIVVKSLGQQFSAVAGLSGATVMGDGSVVVILDPHALVRQEIAKATLQLEESTPDLIPESDNQSRVKTIMVVDDSVTVRKVTTRFLEREGFDVVTAKDGVDALRLLQDDVPDLMLLDIEMPRMDGFEVAKTVRSTKRWETLPIIMITSRTGDKHREHALSLGVNNYLGKPYQEDILLDAIGEILESKARQS